MGYLDHNASWPLFCVRLQVDGTDTLSLKEGFKVQLKKMMIERFCLQSKEFFIGEGFP